MIMIWVKQISFCWYECRCKSKSRQAAKRCQTQGKVNPFQILGKKGLHGCYVADLTKTIPDFNPLAIAASCTFMLCHHLLFRLERLATSDSYHSGKLLCKCFLLWFLIVKAQTTCARKIRILCHLNGPYLPTKNKKKKKRTALICHNSCIGFVSKILTSWTVKLICNFQAEVLQTNNWHSL